MHSAEKPLNQMNRLADMLHFPAAVNAGATLNILLTVTLTWYVEPHHPALAGAWVALVLSINLLPVMVLRRGLTSDTSYPSLGEMDFLGDQHKFSDWVYLAASADMAFWILLTWTFAAIHRTEGTLAAILLGALLVTFSPVLFRRWLR